MRRRFLVLLVLVALAFPGAGWAARCEGVAPGQKPQNTGRDIVGQDLSQIQDRGFIEFAVYENFRPWSWAEGGRPLGVDIEIGRLIAADLGVEARFMLVASGENIEADLRNFVWKGPLIGGRVANVMLRVPYDSRLACRIEQVFFTGRYALEDLVIAYRTEDYPDGGPVPAYFRYDAVAVENDSISDFYLTSFARGAAGGKVSRLPDTGAAMAALAAGEVMAVMGPRGEVEAHLGEGQALHRPPYPGLAAAQWTLGVAVRHTFRALGYAVDDAINAAIADGRMAEIYRRFGLTWSAPE